MGMASIDSTALETAKGVGSGITSSGSTATLCRMQLSAAERAARVEGLVVSDAGERLTVTGLGFMVPEEGWVIHTNGDARCSLALTAALVLDLTVTGEAPETEWIGYLSAEFTQNYSPEGA